MDLFWVPKYGFVLYPAFLWNKPMLLLFNLDASWSTYLFKLGKTAWCQRINFTKKKKKAFDWCEMWQNLLLAESVSVGALLRGLMICCCSFMEKKKNMHIYWDGHQPNGNAIRSIPLPSMLTTSVRLNCHTRSQCHSWFCADKVWKQN